MLLRYLKNAPFPYGNITFCKTCCSLNAKLCLLVWLNCRKGGHLWVPLACFVVCLPTSAPEECGGRRLSSNSGFGFTRVLGYLFGTCYWSLEGLFFQKAMLFHAKLKFLKYKHLYLTVHCWTLNLNCFEEVSEWCKIFPGMLDNRSCFYHLSALRRVIGHGRF